MTMRIETKSAVILLVTFLLGGLIGVLAMGAIAQRRASRVAELRERGFAMQFERLIEPRDEAQRETIRTVLSAAAERNRETMRGAREEIRSSLEEMRQELEPLLDDDQRERLEAAAKRFRRGPPGRPPGEGFGPPGPGRRPPKGREGRGERPRHGTDPAERPPPGGSGEQPPEPPGGN
ncbi:MAG: hypothetical protein V3T25_03885 [Gemmatimonadota bacterium]